MPSAGDVERFAYCPHNWLLHKQGLEGDPRPSLKGQRVHEAVGEALHAAELYRRRSKEGLQWTFRGIGVAAAATLVTLNAVFLDHSPFGYLYLAVSLVLLNCTAGLLTIALYDQRQADRLRKELGIMEGGVIDDDLHGTGELLQDAAWDVTGRPDVVLEIHKSRIPVEVKSGRTPDQPFESHVMQLACYLRLIEVRDGTAPPYGLLSYPEGVFPVHWNDDVKARLRATLHRIGEAERTGTADRDHQHIGRCRGCARRALCDQRLA